MLRIEVCATQYRTETEGIDAPVVWCCPRRICVEQARTVSIGKVLIINVNVEKAGRIIAVNRVPSAYDSDVSVYLILQLGIGRIIHRPDADHKNTESTRTTEIVRNIDVDNVANWREGNSYGCLTIARETTSEHGCGICQTTEYEQEEQELHRADEV